MVEDKYVDIHCHIDYYDDKKIPNILSECHKKDVLIVSNGTTVNSNRKLLKILNQNSTLSICMGLYPIECLKLKDKDIDEEISFIRQNCDKLFGIGEVGIDLREGSDFLLQKKNLEKFISLSEEIDKPIIIHSRKSELQTIEILEYFRIKKVIMHCFSGKMNLVKRIIKNDWYLSVPSIVVFSEHFQNIVRLAPIERLFCETDSPFLDPDRAGENYPCKVIKAYEKIAELKGVSVDKVKSLIFANYLSLR
ncbi:MAG: TatD family hydrolase [Candidatus Pacearchaeota archaeon]